MWTVFLPQLLLPEGLTQLLDEWCLALVLLDPEGGQRLIGGIQIRSPDQIPDAEFVAEVRPTLGGVEGMVQPMQLRTADQTVG